MRPPSGADRRAIIRSSVDFPHPEGPSTARNSPASMSRFIPSITTSWLSKTRRTPSRRSATPRVVPIAVFVTLITPAASPPYLSSYLKLLRFDAFRNAMLHSWSPSSMAARIEDYALIGDCHTAALVSLPGSIDWLCFPRFDSPACFAALVGGPENGRWQIAPAAAVRAVRRRYRGDTLILETDFEADHGAVTLIDFMPSGRGRRMSSVWSRDAAAKSPCIWTWPFGPITALRCPGCATSTVESALWRD